MPPLDMESALARFHQLALELVQAEQESAPLPAQTAKELRDRLSLRLGTVGMPEDEVFELLRALVRATPKTSGKRFFNQLFAGRDVMGTAADLLATLLNVSMYTYKVAGPHALIEQELVHRMCALIGYERGDGVFVPGGSMANLVGMLLGRNEVKERTRDEGLDGQPLVIYVSEDGHYSIRKNAGILGLGRNNVRFVPTAADGGMSPAALAAAIEEDKRAGRLPTVVIATAGTTVLGAFDPIRELAPIAREHGAWLHVDGALGATTLLHPDYRGLVAGCELSDSLAWNPHKLMGMPMSCSVILVQRHGILHRDFNETAEYLFQTDDDELNMGTKSIQCGRRNDALKLWAAWKLRGDEGWAERVEQQFALTRQAAAIVRADDDLILAREPRSITVCFEVRGRSSAAICERMNASGHAQVGYAVVDGRRVIRLATANADLEPADIDRFFADLKHAAAGLAHGDNAVFERTPAQRVALH